MQNSARIDRWFTSAENENAMEDDHAYLWQRMIEKMDSVDLISAVVLDFGCNQGGFLRHLYRQFPFKQGVGVDIAEESLQKARERVRGEPIRYALTPEADDMPSMFDCAFSHEVLYLLPDLAAHARFMRSVLKPGGTYFAAIGCHTGNPLWPLWSDLVKKTSCLSPCDYALDDYAEAFFAAGFEVWAQQYLIDDFILIKRNNAWFPKISDSLTYHTTTKTLFKLVRK